MTEKRKPHAPKQALVGSVMSMTRHINNVLKTIC